MPYFSKVYIYYGKWRESWLLRILVRSGLVNMCWADCICPTHTSHFHYNPTHLPFPLQSAPCINSQKSGFQSFYMVNVDFWEFTHVSTSTALHPWHKFSEIRSLMGWLRLVGSLKLQVSFAKDLYKRDYILQKRPIILRSLLIVATP